MKDFVTKQETSSRTTAINQLANCKKWAACSGKDWKNLIYLSNSTLSLGNKSQVSSPAFSSFVFPHFLFPFRFDAYILLLYCKFFSVHFFSLIVLSNGSSADWLPVTAKALTLQLNTSRELWKLTNLCTDIWTKNKMRVWRIIKHFI